jgi:hypothetical protein
MTAAVVSRPRYPKGKQETDLLMAIAYGRAMSWLREAFVSQQSVADESAIENLHAWQSVATFLVMVLMERDVRIPDSSCLYPPEGQTFPCTLRDMTGHVYHWQ